jgi:hypothetical protein
MVGNMTQARNNELERGGSELTAEEIAEGWYFCRCEWDGMLLHPDMPEAKMCDCRVSLMPPQSP